LRVWLHLFHWCFYNAFFAPLFRSCKLAVDMVRLNILTELNQIYGLVKRLLAYYPNRTEPKRKFWTQSPFTCLFWTVYLQKHIFIFPYYVYRIFILAEEAQHAPNKIRKSFIKQTLVHRCLAQTPTPRPNFNFTSS
jgi:hypothetical protein